MKVSMLLACAALAGLTAFTAGCTMSPESGDASNEDDATPEVSEPAKDPEAFIFRLPDLVAVDPSGVVPQWPGSYCSLDPYGNFTVRVKNIGNATSSVSVVRISGGGGTQNRIVGALAPGAIQAITLPFGSFATCGPDCFFTITVDVTGANAEWNEDNTFSGYCIG